MFFPAILLVISTNSFAVGSKCSDKGSYCGSYQPYCNHSVYYDYLLEQCRKTCNYCHITTTSPPTTTTVSTKPYTGPGGRVLQPGCGTKMSSQARIVGGRRALPGSWPWQANIDYRYNYNNKGHHCGGTLISDEWVLSAAHCFHSDKNKKHYWLKLGAHNISKANHWEQLFSVKELILHPKYNPNNFDYDLALLRLNSTATLNERVQTACLAGRSTSFSTGTECYITGWGLLAAYGSAAKVLRQTKVPLVSQKDCKASVKDLNYVITSRMFCAGYNNGSADSCDGDSGGPLVCRKTDATHHDVWYLWGTISWGVGCAQKGYYGVLASPKAMRSWIDSIVFKSRV